MRTDLENEHENEARRLARSNLFRALGLFVVFLAVAVIGYFGKPLGVISAVASHPLGPAEFAIIQWSIFVFGAAFSFAAGRLALEAYGDLRLVNRTSILQDALMK